MSARLPNTYTETWFELFLATQEPTQTAREVAFLQRSLPLPPIERILDVCCGYGRHAAPLADAGYRVVGIDRDPDVVERARSMHGESGVDFRVHDMTKLSDLAERFDAVICMWQSFGYHDAPTNADVLRQMAGMLTPGGRLVLDIYNRAFFESRQGTRTTEQQGVEVVTTQRLDNDRLIVDVEYCDRNERETFDWQVFVPDGIADLAASVGLKQVLACTSFDETEAPSPDRPRMQLVFATQ